MAIETCVLMLLTDEGEGEAEEEGGGAGVVLEEVYMGNYCSVLIKSPSMIF